MAKKKASEEIKETSLEEELQEEIITEEKEEENPLVVENEALKLEVASLKDQLLRNQAELQNFKRRMTDERIKDRKYAVSELVKNLLSTIDNFEMGLQKEKNGGKIKAELKGFELIHRDLLNLLEQEGLKEVEALNQPFNPQVHQAVMTEKVEGMDKNIVVEVYQKGYLFKERLLRPAMVKVSE